MASEFILTPKQTKAYDLLTNEDDLALMFGGGKGGGKTFVLCLWVAQWVEFLCDLFKLRVNAMPIPLGFIGRKRSTDFTKTTLETFKKIIPPSIYHINKQEKEIVMYDRAKIFYGGLDDQHNINKFNSAELAFCALDQAEETTRSDVGVLQASLRLKVNKMKPPYKELYTANPAQCWLRDDFVKGKRKDGHFIPALYKENPHLPESYDKTLATAFSYDPVLLAAYRDGDWDLIQAENLFITAKMLDDLESVQRYSPIVRRVIACDPSEGGDECVIMAFEKENVVEMAIYHEKDPMKIVGYIMAMGARFNTNNYAIDAIGVGSGICGRLYELGQNKKWNIIAIRSGEGAEDESCANLRTEMWKYTSERIRAKECYPIEDEETRRQLTSTKYRVVRSDTKIQVLPKQTVKKDLGRSPDRADCYVYGIWALQYMPDDMAIDNVGPVLHKVRSQYQLQSAR